MVLTNKDLLASLYSSFYLAFRPKHWRHHQGHLKGQVFATALGGCAPSQQWFCAAVKGLCSSQELNGMITFLWTSPSNCDFPSPSFPTYNHWMSLDHASKMGKVQQTYCSCTRILTTWQTQENIQGHPFLLLRCFAALRNPSEQTFLDTLPKTNRLHSLPTSCKWKTVVKGFVGIPNCHEQQKLRTHLYNHELDSFIPKIGSRQKAQNIHFDFTPLGHDAFWKGCGVHTTNTCGYSMTTSDYQTTQLFGTHKSFMVPGEPSA